MEKVIRHGAFSRITVLICLKAVSSFFRLTLYGQRKKAFGRAEAYARVSFIHKTEHSFHLRIRALGFSSRGTHQPPAIAPAPAPAPACSLQQQFLVSKYSIRGSKEPYAAPQWLSLGPTPSRRWPLTLISTTVVLHLPSTVLLYLGEVWVCELCPSQAGENGVQSNKTKCPRPQAH